MRPRPRRRLAAIRAKSMQVKTERVFRSSETPQLKLATRNVPSVKVRVYKIDLETYFRKMHSIAGIQRLDVSLIDPDTTLEFAVPDYAKYKPLTSSIPVPLPDGLKAGVAAVTVSSPDAGNRPLLLIQSDLEILVKSSRDEVLIFAENAATGKPWPGVRLLISDGRSVFAEAKTGDDGFFRQRYARVERRGLPAGLCRRRGRARGLDRRAAGRRVGRARTGRPDLRRYRSPELLCRRNGPRSRLRRHADGDRFAIEPGKKLTVEVLGDCRPPVAAPGGHAFGRGHVLVGFPPAGGNARGDLQGPRTRSGRASPGRRFPDRPAGRRDIATWSSTCPSRSIIAARSSKARSAPCCPRTVPLAGVKVSVSTGRRADDHGDDRRPRRGPFCDPHGRIGVVWPHDIRGGHPVAIGILAARGDRRHPRLLDRPGDDPAGVRARARRSMSA